MGDSVQNYFEKHMSDAIKKMEDHYVDSGIFSEIYPFTTENICGYINEFNLNNKSLLTVGSSGDQVINAVMNNCKDIDVVDICPFNKYYFYLKKASIMLHSYEEFKYFFCYYDFPKTFLYNNKYVFNKESYSKLKDLLRLMDYESFLFWEELFSCYDRIKIRKELFKSDEDKIHILKQSNLYLNDEYSFNECKNKIKSINPRFITSDIRNVKLDRNYDNIWLSNIGQYLRLEELKNVVDNLSNNLNNEGKMLVSYLYRTVKSSRYNENYLEIFNLDKVFELFKEYNIELTSFTGIYGLLHDTSNMKDSILIYKK